MHRKILLQLSIVLAICIVSEGIVSVLPFAFPSSVTAILILAFLLGMKILKEEQIQETADFMLSCMALVFVPLTVGVIEDLELLKGQVAGFLIVVFVSLIITFLGTYASVRMIQKLTGRKSEHKQTENMSETKKGGEVSE